MKLGDRIVDGEFLERPNRYVANVKINGETVCAHLPDPGRLPGLMIPGRRARLIYNPAPKRKTDYTLALIRHGSIWVSVYPVFANKLVGNGFENGSIDCFGKFTGFRAEASKGESRFDFQLDFSSLTGFVEVKSVSFVEEGLGKFPDAPTERGRKHVQELISLRDKGYYAGVLFISQRSDTRSITSNNSIDPQFGLWLRKAREAGVELFGYNCRVTPSTVSISQQIPVIL